MEQEYTFVDDILDLTEDEQYIYARYRYRIGKPIMNNYEYDCLDKKIKQSERLRDYVLRSYDADPIPYDILYKIGYTTEKVNTETKDFTLQPVGIPACVEPYLSDVECKSIHSEDNLEACYPWMVKHRGQHCVMMPKMDGINTTSFYIGEDSGSKALFRYSQSRGDSGNVLDYTRNMSIFLPKVIETDLDCLKVTAEAIYDSRYMDYVRKVTGVELVDPRTAAMSFLRVKDYPEELYHYMRVVVFKTSYGSKLSQSVAYAKKLGFETVPMFGIIPDYRDFEDFKEKITPVIWQLKTYAANMGLNTDGIVIQVDDRVDFANLTTTGLYDYGNLAIKAVAWKPNIFRSRVKRIVMESSDDRYSCKAIVDPVRTESGRTLTNVNLYNPRNMMDNDVTEGSLIEFRYFNETTIEFLRKIS